MSEIAQLARIAMTFPIWSKRVQPGYISALLSATADRIVLRGADRNRPQHVPNSYVLVQFVGLQTVL
jgi:hypothetical protein